jgi:uncharacterized protein
MTVMKAPPYEHRLELLVIQPTPFCNLDCSYCYLPFRNSTARISQEVLRRTFEQVLHSRYTGPSFTVVWHAGEPLVMPIHFYEGAFQLLDALNTSRIEVNHSFQTNGTLITNAWCDFIKRTRTRIGVSVDGPQFIHDARRKTRRGGGTHQKVMQGIGCLQDHSIDFHVISVLTQEALNHPDDFFSFYRENGIERVGFNIEEVEGVNASSSLAAEETPRKVRAFLTRFLQLVRSSQVKLDVREFRGMGEFIARGDGFIDGNQENTPMRIITVDCAGNFSTFSPELLGAKHEQYGDFALGNMLRDRLDGIETTVKFRRISSEIEAGIARCRSSCEYFGVCGGGSPSNKFFEHESFASAETLHCRLSKKAVVDVLLETLETSLGLA